MIYGMREYLLRICAVAMICAVVFRLARGNSTVKLIIKLLCSIVLAYSIIHPIKKLDLQDFGDLTTRFRDEAEQAAQVGELASATAWVESITEGTEAYILEKAREYHLNLSVEVELSDDAIPVPVSVSLTGNVAPYAKSVLGDTITRDLNIPKENQIWISQ